MSTAAALFQTSSTEERSKFPIDFFIQDEQQTKVSPSSITFVVTSNQLNGREQKSRSPSLMTFS